MARRTRRELAAHWAWARNCKAALGLWRRRLEQQRAEEQWAQVQGWRRKHNALHHWHSCWQRQQVLHEKYQAWTRVRLQGLGKAMLQGWQQATAHQRQRVTRPERLLLQSHFQAWQGFVRETRVLQTQCRVFWDNRTRRVLGAAFAVWWEALVAVVQTRKQFVAGAAISCWSKVRLHGRAHKRLRQTCTQQAYVAWRRAPGQHQEPRRQAEEKTQAWARVALCWMLWVYESHLLQVSQVHAAQKLSTRVLEAWAEAVAQARAHRVGFAQLQQAGPTPRLQTHWAQGQAPLRVQLETWAEAKEASTVRPRSEGDLKLCPMLSSREYLLFPVSTPAQWMQMTQYRISGGSHPASLPSIVLCSSGCSGLSPVTGPSACPFRQHPADPLWEPADTAADPSKALERSARGWGESGCGHAWGGGYLSEAAVHEQGRTRNSQHWHLEALLGQLRDSQQAKCLAAAWQQWVDALREEQLAATLLRQWHLRWAWRLWRRRVLQLWVAQRFLRQEDSWILSQDSGAPREHQVPCGMNSSPARVWKPHTMLAAIIVGVEDRLTARGGQ
ncbi:PREDICTED: uncharacterized protein LOC102856298 [Elephantulus edwardii]|uniref:uncharacterized protein LOC102856298 n=1 Tax=Elephantulus edwardii TaxID=28737 RepID=UPI0003F083C3|nr:PREDICTED: uncharacterized protein LOC102856298 [Elephantulus edwardii]